MAVGYVTALGDLVDDDVPAHGEEVDEHKLGDGSLPYDHRAVEGAYATRFLRRMNEILTARKLASDLQPYRRGVSMLTPC